MDFDVHDHCSDSPPTIWSILLVVLVALYVFMGYPIPGYSQPGPPEGVETYVSEEGYLCWDKKTCCDKTDESTCVTIPICTPQ